jgi:hypothetical protein
MKTYKISYRLRGANYNFMTPYTRIIRASSAKEAREQLIMMEGDIYKVVKTQEVK